MAAPITACPMPNRACVRQADPIEAIVALTARAYCAPVLKVL